jgi:glycerol uptake facilitator-like aquaporin
VSRGGPTVPKAIGLGAGAGAAAVLLWIVQGTAPGLLVLPYVVALAVTALCGAYILLATWYDSYRNPRRGVRIRPIRGFDIAAGLLLTAPAIWALYPFLRAL